MPWDAASAARRLQNSVVMPKHSMHAAATAISTMVHSGRGLLLEPSDPPIPVTCKHACALYTTIQERDRSCDVYRTGAKFSRPENIEEVPRYPTNTPPAPKHCVQLLQYLAPVRYAMCITRRHRHALTAGQGSPQYRLQIEKFCISGANFERLNGNFMRHANHCCWMCSSWQSMPPSAHVACVVSPITLGDSASEGVYRLASAAVA